MLIDFSKEMTEDFSISDLKRSERSQALGAFISTVADRGDQRRYHELGTGLSEYSRDLLGREDGIYQLVKIGISKTDDRPFRVLVLGAGTGQMAEELVSKVGAPGKLQIDELSMGDPRTAGQKEYDERNNIRFINGDINDTKLESGSYDLVISRMFMLHMTDPLRVLKRISRSMREGAELYADFMFRRDFAVRFQSSISVSSEQQAISVLDKARSNGATIFIDDNTGLYYRKGRERLTFENVGYEKDRKNRIHYKAV